jgi:hypothetical protein
MSLPACQERMLSGIADALRKGEPRLASIFAIFSRLTRDEALPRTEQLTPQPWLRRMLARAGRAWRFFYPPPPPRGIAATRPTARLRAAVVLPVLLIIMASATVVAAIGGTPSCTPAHRPAAIQTRWATCAASGTVAQSPHGEARSPATGHKSSHSSG